jgi:3-oxosteroid 1-dehydrogenase
VLWRYYSDVGQRLRLKRSRFLTGGNALMAQLKMAIDQRQVPLWLNSPLRELIVEDGRVTGAIVVKEGVEYRVRARRGVILGAGGFERNGAMRQEYLGGNTNNPAWSAGLPSNTGDALTAGVGAGASTKATNNAWWAPVIWVPDEDRARPIFIERGLPGAIMVDRSGRRFTNEASSYHIVGREMKRLNTYEGPGAPYYMLFDSTFRSRYPMGPIIPLLPDFFIPKSLRKVMVKANSLEELAQKAGLPLDNLRETIARFNEFAATGVDLDFGRGSVPYDNLFGDARGRINPNLGSLVKAPFYALPVYPGDIGTCGGLRTDEVGAVLDESGKRIPGLYAVGNTAATVMGEAYPGAGSTLAGGMTFGYLAAQHAAKGEGSNTSPLL